MHHILPFLSIPDIKNLSMTNRAFNKEYKESIIKSDWLWRQKADELGLLVHNDATDVYYIVRHTLKRFYKYTYISRSGLKIDCSRGYSTKIKPVNDKQIKRIAGLIEYLKLLSVAIFWKELLCRIKVSKEEYDKYIPRPTTCPAPLFLNFQSEGFTKLQELYLFENRLKTLPESIVNLRKLEKFFVSCNKLQSLPGSIGNLTQLEEFYLFHNCLKFLPESIGNLINLNCLYIDPNPLHSLPSSIKNLSKLKFSDFS